MATKLTDILKDAEKFPEFNLEKGKVCYSIAFLIDGKEKQIMSYWHRTDLKAKKVLMNYLKKESKKHKVERHPEYVNRPI